MNCGLIPINFRLTPFGPLEFSSKSGILYEKLGEEGHTHAAI